MGRILHIDPFAGAAGDMFVAMLLDLGGDFAALQRELKKLPLQGEYTLTAAKTLRLGLSGTYFQVHLAGDATHQHGHEQGQEHGNDHGHTHAHADSHTHDHAHDHAHQHGHEHTHEHAHNHTHEHTHEGEHEHAHPPGLKPARKNARAHSHAHVHTHEHQHEHPHVHPHVPSPTHDHSHAHGTGAAQADKPGRPHSHDPARAWKNIRALIEGSRLAPQVQTRAIAAFQVLAVSEGKQHGVAAEAVTFHEVGAVDSIVDIVGAAILLDQLGVDEITCGPVATGGGGYVDCDHGRFPVPAPATLEILRGVPLRATDIPAEMCTPTGAAMLKAWCGSFGQQPALVVEAIGYGAGRREHSRGIPNLLRGMLGKRTAATGSRSGAAGMASAAAFAGVRDSVIELEANIDDMTAQGLADAGEVLLAAGALDVQLIPATMKKSRPGHLLRVLCAPEQEAALAQAILRHTSTFGVRSSRKDRFTLQREFRPVTTAFGVVRMKIGLLGDQPVHFVPEYEDLRAAARAHNVGLEEVRAAALAAFDGPAGDPSTQGKKPAGAKKKTQRRK